MHILVADASGFLFNFIRGALEDSYTVVAAHTLSEIKSILESRLFEWMFSADSFSDGYAEEMWHRKFRMPANVVIYSDFHYLPGERSLFLSEHANHFCFTASGIMELLNGIRANAVYNSVSEENCECSIANKKACQRCADGGICRHSF